MRIQIAGAKLFDGTGDVYRENSFVVTDGSAITKVGTRSETRPEPDTHVEKADGLFLFPGLINVHSHVSFMYMVGDLEPQYTRPEPELALHASRICRLLLAQGITTVRDMGGPGDLHLKVRNAVADGELLGPRMVACGQPLASTGGHGWHISFEADGADGLLKAARTQLKRGADFIKVMASDDPWLGAGPEYTRKCLTDDEIRAAFDEAHSWGKLACCHVKGSRAIEAVLEAGADIIDHGAYLTREQAARMAESGVFYDPTLSAHAQSLHPRFERESRIIWADNHQEANAAINAAGDAAIAAAREAGVKLLVGTDTVGTFAEEVDLLRRHGVSPVDSLLACTRWPAEALRLDSELGTIEPGKRADLVAFGSDPLKNAQALDDVRFVIKDGKILRPEELLHGEDSLAHPVPPLARFSPSPGN